MKVAELIALLEGYDPDAEVYFASQPSWPFENSIAGVASREEVALACAEDGEEPTYEKGCSGDDVLIAEGSQIRYASKALWSALRR